MVVEEGKGGILGEVGVLDVGTVLIGVGFFHGVVGRTGHGVEGTGGSVGGCGSGGVGVGGRAGGRVWMGLIWIGNIHGDVGIVGGGGGGGGVGGLSYQMDMQY